jgi:hypothetical protein
MRHPTLKLLRTSTPRRETRALWLGFAGVVLARLFSRRLPRPDSSDLRKHDYRASTQHMGVRFTERIRDTFRFRWIRRTS